MGIGFSQSAEHRVNGILPADWINNLSEILLRHTGLCYSCTTTDKGFFLKPALSYGGKRNSFIPEIDIEVCQEGDQTLLRMKGRPVKFVRIFMTVWLVLLFLMEALAVALTAVSGQGEPSRVIFPVVLGIFGYLLCKIAGGIAFRSVVKTIRKEIN